MKALMILGAVIGFLIGGGFSLAYQSPWPSALWRACVAALAAFILTRWWTGIWMRGLRESLETRHHPRPVPTIAVKSGGKA
jgi:hypothetical protein